MVGLFFINHIHIWQFRAQSSGMELPEIIVEMQDIKAKVGYSLSKVHSMLAR